MTALAVHLEVVPSGPLEDFIGHQRQLGRAEKTISKRRTLISALERWLAPVPLGDATTAHVDAWLDELCHTPRSRDSYIADLRVFYRWAVAEGLADADPTATVRQGLMRAAPVVPAGPAIGAFADHQRGEGRGEKSVSHHRWVLSAFERWLAPSPLLAASTVDLETWLDGLALMRSSRTAYIAALRAFYRWAVAEGLADADPTTDVHRVLVARRPRATPCGTELGAFVGYQRGLGRAEKTIRMRRGVISAFERWLAPVPLGSATAAHLGSWLDGLSLSEVSRDSYSSALRLFYRWAVAEGVARSDPTIAIAVAQRGRAVRVRTKAGRAHLAIVAPAESPPDLSTVDGRVRFFCDELLKRELMPRTIHRYRHYAKDAEWFCDERGYSLRNVPPGVLGEYLALRPKSYATRAGLRAAFTHYWEIFKRKDPPLWMVRVPRKPRMICKALEDDDASRLAQAALAQGGRPAMAVLLAMYQAFRREDIATMRWDDLRKDGWLSVHGKGDLPAQLPLHPVVKEALDKLERTDETWVFPGRSGRPHVGPATVWQWIRELSDEAGLGKVAAHRLRHTCLAVANDRSGDLRATMEFARHAKVDTTMGYTRTTEQRLRAVLATLNYEPGAATRYENEQRIVASLAGLSGEDLAWIEAAVLELGGEGAAP